MFLIVFDRIFSHFPGSLAKGRDHGSIIQSYCFHIYIIIDMKRTAARSLLQSGLFVLLICLVGNPGTIIGDPLVVADLVPRIAAGRCR